MKDRTLEKNRILDKYYNHNNEGTTEIQIGVDEAGRGSLIGPVFAAAVIWNNEIDNEKLKELSPEIKELKYTIDNKNFEKSISIIDNLFEKLGEISGTEEFANKLDDLISIIDNDEVDEQKLLETSSETFDLFNAEVTWRADANKNLLPELIKYNDVIKHNIGLRLQSRLTKEQAKFVARCNSVHRDISLNF